MSFLKEKKILELHIKNQLYTGGIFSWLVNFKGWISKNSLILKKNTLWALWLLAKENKVGNKFLSDNKQSKTVVEKQF